MALAVSPSAAPPRSAVVTGAARGIGAAAVMRLAEAGFCVLAVDIADDIEALDYPLAKPDQLDGVAKLATERFGGSVSIEPFVADVREDAAIAAAIREAERLFGGVDVAVAAAGVVAGGAPMWDMPVAAERAVLDVNLVGALNLARHAVPAMLRRPRPRQGRFIAISSAAAHRGLPLMAAYCASKAGVAGLVRALAVELGASGITANAISPGSTNTSILTASAALYSLDSAEAFAGQQPIQRLLDADEIAMAIAYVASHAGSGITGANLPVDGGLSL